MTGGKQRGNVSTHSINKPTSNTLDEFLTNNQKPTKPKNPSPKNQNKTPKDAPKADNFNPKPKLLNKPPSQDSSTSLTDSSQTSSATTPVIAPASNSGKNKIEDPAKSLVNSVSETGPVTNLNNDENNKISQTTQKI